MSYIFKITTESYLLTGSGEGAALIDADVVFHLTGFPMIPARRVKGMLKESLEEVLEIFGKPKQEVDATVSSLFGYPGTETYQGKLLFHNLMLDGWNQIVEEIMDVPKDGLLQPNFIKSYFTTEVQQTAIGKEGKRDEIDGVAKKRSLRNYRVIKPGYTFVAPLTLTDVLTQEEEKYLKYAVLNLRHAGTRRNRGFGKIKCQLEPIKADTHVPAEQSERHPATFEAVIVSISTLSPVVLADLQGEQNTVFTRKYISGNQLRGLLANAYMRSRGLAYGKAHHDPDFQELFVSGKIKFGDLGFKQGKTIPLHLHEYKRYSQKKPISVFAKNENDGEITKSIKGIGQIQNGIILKDGYTPKTTFNFHNSRPNRAAGRNTELDAEGGIFYYESLNEGQTFQGCIAGEPGSLSKLLAAFPASFKARLGRSRSAQYGFIEVSLEPNGQVNNTKQLSPGEYVLILQSPLILLNEWGFPSPTVGELEKYLSKNWGLEEGQVKIENAAVAFTNVEQFNAVWQAKSEKMPAFKEGSSFLVHLPKIENIPTHLGEWAEQGFGRVVFELYNPGAKYEIGKPSDINEMSTQEQQNQNVKFANAILVEIQNKYKAEEKQIEVKTKAIKAAQKSYKGIKNHLIGRVEAVFQRATSQEYVDDWINALFRANSSGKPAAEKLLNAEILHEVSDKELKETGVKAKFAKTGLGELPFELTRIYWITFFQTLRKKNKSDGK
ncbi:MAG: hypothetical protein KIS77_22400 [Saprospiraceae bacterium]|nr:hypothetical protein [Saprospiraceae bacterium]